MVLWRGRCSDSCSPDKRRDRLLFFLSCHPVSLLYGSFLSISAPASSVSADRASRKLPGGFVTAFLCAIPIPSDSLFCLSFCVAVFDSLMTQTIHGLLVIRPWQERCIPAHSSLYSRFGLTCGVVQPRDGWDAAGHLGHLIHSVKTQRVPTPFSWMVVVLYVAECTVYRAVVRGNSLGLFFLMTSSKLSLYLVSGSVLPLSGGGILRGGRSMYTWSTSYTAIKNRAFLSRSSFYVHCAAVCLGPTLFTA